MRRRRGRCCCAGSPKAPRSRWSRMPARRSSPIPDTSSFAPRQEAGHTVTALPGASAVLAALAVAGLPTDQFLFAGFLPPKEAARRARIAELARIPATLVLFETGPRIAATLADLAAGLGRQREAALCRELTKLHEEIRRGDLADAGGNLRRQRAARRDRCCHRAAPGARSASARPRPKSCCARRCARVSLKDAVGEVADATGLPRREVYQRALALAKETKEAREAKHGAPR